MDNPPLERAALELIFYMLIYVPKVLIRATEFRWWWFWVGGWRLAFTSALRPPSTTEMTLKIINRKVGGVGPSVRRAFSGWLAVGVG